MSDIESLRAQVAAPIDMVLHCPKCGEQHIDAPVGPLMVDGRAVTPSMWNNPPHRSHLCHGCGHIWRPADVPTYGVASVKTKGKNDGAIVHPVGAAQVAALEATEPPELPEPDISVPFLSEVRKVNQGDYYRADKVQALLKQWAQVYKVAKLGHEQAFAKSQEAHARIAALEAREPRRPDLLERLSYHALERDDLTVEDCIEYLANGWTRVHGRTERHMVMQLLHLMAGGYTSEREAALEAERDKAVAQSLESAAAVLRAVGERDAWNGLYRRAIDEANGMLTLIRDNPEYPSAERRRIRAIEVDAARSKT